MYKSRLSGQTDSQGLLRTEGVYWAQISLIMPGDEGYFGTKQAAQHMAAANMHINSTTVLP